MFKIKGALKNYAWGGYSFIPMLLGAKPDGKPYSEIWFGDHPLGPSTLNDGTKLFDWIKKDPLNRLGQIALDKYTGKLPFLIKVLDVRSPLSIQVHPNIKQAINGYNREKKLNVGQDKKNYKDKNHKPEIMYALSDFFMLSGFLDGNRALSNLSRFESLSQFKDFYSKNTLRDFVKWIFSQNVDFLYKSVFPIYADNITKYDSGRISKKDSLYWFIRAFISNRENKIQYDAGLIMIFIMNLVYVPKGKAMYQAPGVPHAYLEGKAIELMSNSDNVIRCGLTAKHIDIEELLCIADFSPSYPSFLVPSEIEKCIKKYSIPIPDFELMVYPLKENETIKIETLSSSAIMMIYSGEVFFYNDKSYVEAFSAFFICPNSELKLHSETNSIIFVAKMSETK